MRFVKPVLPMNRILFAIFLAATMTGMSQLSGFRSQDQGQAGLAQFDLLTADSGWVLRGRSLFWTSDAGQTWREIGPSGIPVGAQIQDVKFIDPNTGWVLWTTTTSDGGSAFHIAHTRDAGNTWTFRSPALLSPEERSFDSGKAQMSWFNEGSGWISVEQGGSSNSSIASLFMTIDGGNSWNRSDLPAAGDIYFSNPRTGWLVGGADGSQIFATRDGGVTWEKSSLIDQAEDGETIVYPPKASAGRALFVMTHTGIENNLEVFTLDPSSDTRSLIGRVTLDAQPGRIGLSILDPENFVAVIQGTDVLVHMTNGKITLLKNTDGLSASIAGLDMVSPDVGWARSVESTCEKNSLPEAGKLSVSCSSSIRLLQTKDGGVTWQEIHLPPVPAGANSSETLAGRTSVTTNTLQNLENTDILIGQGFDRCEIPSLSQMQTWWDNSPYQAVNLYIGGSSRGCDNNALSSYYLFRLHQQGWTFIPTWVGPQAPCTGFASRISNDAGTAFDQGIAEANLAVDRLWELGLTGPDQTGSAIYYDIEYYDGDTACRDAVNAFMNGWISQLHVRGNLGGVYGSTRCDSSLSDFRSIANVPDLIWAARWYHNLGYGYYDPTADVWDLGSCVPNSDWAKHQRIRQYEGDHNETWGNLTLDIDSNALDGVVAIPHDYPFVNAIVRANSNPSSASSIGFTVSFSKSVTGVDPSDFMLTTTGVSGAAITGLSGSGTAYTVTVDTGACNGTIRLDLVDDDSISDGSGNVLGVAGIGNGSFSAGETYTITKPSNTNVKIANTVKGLCSLGAGQSVRQSYAGTDNGPVKVSSTDGSTSLLTSERFIYSFQTSKAYAELMGYPDSQLTTEYWFPWYNNLSYSTQLRVSNMGSGSAQVKVYAGGTQIDSFTLAAGQAQRSAYSMDQGPLHVVSTDKTTKILASERFIQTFGSSASYSEMMGYPGDQLATEYWFPWYNNLTYSTQLRVSNMGGKSAEVKVYAGGSEIDSFTLGVGEARRIAYDGVDKGPLHVVSTDGVTPILASERFILTFGSSASYAEMMGYPGSQLASEYCFPWYNNTTDNSLLLSSQLRVSNMGGSTAQVKVTLAGSQIDSFSLGAGQGARKTYPSINSGPLCVVSSDGTTPILASERFISTYLSSASYSEMMGYPSSRLDDTYWFPWYNNVSYQTELRMAKP
jgi:hypothetical protein